MSTPMKPELLGLQLMRKALEVAKASQGVGATRLAKQMPASALNHIWFAILDAMEGLRTPNVLTTRIEI